MFGNEEHLDEDNLWLIFRVLRKYNKVIKVLHLVQAKLKGDKENGDLQVTKEFDNSFKKVYINLLTNIITSMTIRFKNRSGGNSQNNSSSL